MPAVQLAAYLQGRGVSAMSYHAGLSAAARQDVSDSLASGRVSVVTCTTALSTGLDCSRVDGVLHYSLPSSMEEYVQQVCSHLPAHGGAAAPGQASHTLCTACAGQRDGSLPAVRLVTVRPALHARCPSRSAPAPSFKVGK